MIRFISLICGLNKFKNTNNEYIEKWKETFYFTKVCDKYQNVHHMFKNLMFLSTVTRIIRNGQNGNIIELYVLKNTCMQTLIKIYCTVILLFFYRVFITSNNI